MAKRRQPAGPQLVVDVPGVESETRIQDLTVRQFAMVQSQIIAQVFGLSRQSQPDMIGLLRDSLTRATPSRDTALDETIRQAQLAILDGIPKVLAESRQRAEREPL